MRLNIAIDGPVGAGKSSIADAAAARLGILHLDTGAMYRALGLKTLREGVDPAQEDAVVALCQGLNLAVQVGEQGQRTLLDGEDVSSQIRTPEVSMAASTVSRYAQVRKHMVALQQQLAAAQDMIVDGRDICTTVLPQAPLKIYLTASSEERARRRWKEMQEKGEPDTFEEVLAQVIARDEQDMHRPVEPLRQAEDATLLDSTNLTFDQVVDQIVEMAEAVRNGD
ncbi:MAG: (d)CMP kinase [Clostridia bacterium]|nr:(d)CMP kinase [Clostridia bacterium]